MSTPGTVEPYSGQGGGVSPSATASGTDSATWALGEVLKNMIRKSAMVFHTEAEVDNAIVAVQNWVNRSVSKSAVAALATGNEVAPKEDVSLRVPAGAPQSYAANPNLPGIDYTRLAAAIVAAQKNEGAVSGQVIPPER